MAQSLFDNRYRYDYIYPRGRSGETLRAHDTQDNHRPVVIKRPAPNDAPPIRAGQEVSIVNERRALQRLAGHPVLTEFLDSGQFVVGGVPHQYIVMERAEGLIISDFVRELKANQERMAELEMLVILDQLLDLLHAAHAKDIVYNDVDAKHLFWSRDDYALKVIDWGNAVFLEGDEITQQGISRQTDIFQVGELLYYIVTGGRRAEVPRDAGADFRMDFADDDRRVHSKLQTIISKALHPNLRMRYTSIAALRADLNNYRAPLERDRNNTVNTVAEKLKRADLSMSELRTLRTMIEPALNQDAGYPLARETHSDIVDKLRDLSVEADLDASRIYMQSHNWKRALDLLSELRGKAGTKTGELIDLMTDISEIMHESALDPVPQAIDTAIQQMYDEQFAAAASSLLKDAPSEAERTLQWQVAERISSRIPEVLLLRPNLYRLHTALDQVGTGGISVKESLAVLGEIDKTLETIGTSSLDLSSLRDGYRSVVDQISAIVPLLETVSIQHEIPNKQLPLSSLQRSLNAAMALADNMHVIGRQAAASPRDALNSLDISRSIDPPNPVWDDLEDFLKRLYDRLQTSQTYVPAADGSDLEDWLEVSRDKLTPFQERLFDEMLVNMVRGLDTALQSWRYYQDMVLQGNRLEVVNALLQAAESVNTISPALSQWFRQLRVVVEGANYVERHALPGGLGRALADGWAAFDRGRLSESERLGQQAYESARSEAGRLAASRLQDLSKLTREWVERNGVNSSESTTTLFDKIERLFTADELAMRQNFERQMPSIETYLKAMSKGIVATYEDTSTAALRLLFVYYTAQGALDAHEGRLDDGEFWRDAATKTLPEFGARHIITRTLDEYIIRRRDLIEAENFFGQINGKHILPELVNMRRRLEENTQARLFAPAIQSLRDFELALRDWSDGEFRAAGLKLDTAVKGITDAEKSAEFSLTGYRTWLMDLMKAAASLAVQARDMRVIIERRPAEPEATVGRVLDEQVTVTEKLLGETYAATLRQWRDTYQTFVTILGADERRSKRLEKLGELFQALFIDRHPPYPLYRHWYSSLEAQSEFQAPPTDDPTPRIQADVTPDADFSSSKYTAEDTDDTPRRGLPRGVLIIGVTVILALVIAAAGFALLQGNNQPAIELTIPPTTDIPTDVASATPIVTEEIATTAPTTDPIVVPVITTVAASPTPNERAITLEPTDPPATHTPITPTATPTLTQTPTETLTPTLTYTPSITPTAPPPTRTPLPEGGLRGNQELLSIFEQEFPFNPELFAPIGGGVYRMGRGTASDGDIIRIVPDAVLLEEFYGNDATSRIRSVEAQLTLRTFDPLLLNADEPSVFFGMGLESVNDGNNIALQVNAASLNAINVLAITNNESEFLTQRAVDAVIVRLRIERDNITDEVFFYYNDELLHRARFIAGQEPVLPVLYVADGSVVVGVNSWRVNLR